MIAFALVFVFGASVAIAAQAPTNATIAKTTSNIQASFISFGIGFIALAILVLIFGQGSFREIVDAPWWQLIGGFYGAFAVFTAITCVPVLGAVVMSTAMMFGQFAMSIFVDAFGLFLTQPIAVSALRIAGCVLVAIGIIFTYIGKSKTSSGHEKFSGKSVLFLLMSVTAGALGAIQAPSNAALASHIGQLEASLMNFAVGTTVILVVMLIMNKGHWQPVRGAKPWQFLGGIYGAAMVTAGVVATPILGVTLMAAVSMFGQLIMGGIIDTFGLIRMPKIKMNSSRWIGIVLVALGFIAITIAKALL